MALNYCNFYLLVKPDRVRIHLRRRPLSPAGRGAMVAAKRNGVLIGSSKLAASEFTWVQPQYSSTLSTHYQESGLEETEAEILEKL